jgi:Cu(I)/Ag(I) efflux system membrane fusion protein
MKPGTRWAIGIGIVGVAAIGATLIPGSPLRRWWEARQTAQVTPSAKATDPSGQDQSAHAGMPGMPAEPGGGAVPETANTIVISQEKLQSVGVRFEPAQRRSLERLIRTVGRAEMDERRLAHVNIKLDGWIQDLGVNYTGEKVARGQLLFTLYSPELLATQREYLLALKAASILKNNPSTRAIDNSLSLVESSKQRLRLWDITDAQIQDLERTGEASKTVAFYSPISGTVIKKTAVAGMKVNAGEEMYTISDLSQLWIVADIYEYELPFIRLGQSAVVSLSYDPGNVVSGRVAFIYPSLDPETRTAKVRFEVPNPAERLKPEMYANVELKIPLGRRLAVPRDAILETGERQVIFINHGEGKLEWRNAKLGVQAGDWVEILEGLKEGEQIVTSANFLIDSESRLKSAVSGMAGMSH